jgi:murein DD-endopeptidase MepM/ murein hydrolase activator NlpD
MRLFPNEQIGGWGYINLNTFARGHTPAMEAECNRLYDDPKWCNFMVRSWQSTLGLSNSYGGWLENRSTLWRKSYLDDGVGHLHLGVDFNVKAGTAVAATDWCTVIKVDDDSPLKGGWGPRVIVHQQNVGPIYLVYAHLDTSITCRDGDVLRPGQVFAQVGRLGHNGGWYEHLHVQAISIEAWEYCKYRLDELDGYGQPNQIEELARKFPDPLPYVM